MADEVIKKARILREDLPPLNAEQDAYILRYRVISEDKNRYSHWSPVSIINPGYVYTTNTITHSNSGSITTVVWDQVSVNKGSTLISKAKQYDIWVKWNKNTDGSNGDWLYQQRVETNSLVLITPSDYTINGVSQGSSPNRLSVEVYLPGNPITRDYTSLKLYDGGPFSV
jgi:hypothetical protein